MTFDEWWEKYSKSSSLNREYLSFLDVGRLKDEMKLAFYHRLPDNQKIQLDKSIHSTGKSPCGLVGGIGGGKT